MGYYQTIPHGVMFHHFHGESHLQSQGSISQKEFDAVLNFIGINRFLPPSDWINKAVNQKLEQGDLCLTFDDGLLCQREIALPVLDAYNLKAFWFVYSSVFEGHMENLEIYRLFRTKYFESITDFYNIFFETTQISLDPYKEEIETMRKQFPFYSTHDIQFRILRDRVLGKRNYETVMDGLMEKYHCNRAELSKNLWMDNEDLKFLSQEGHQIGLHSYSHPTKLEELSYHEQFEEYRKNINHLKQVCGQKPQTMSHPCNSYNDNTLAILRKLGIDLGFKSNMYSHNMGKGLGPHLLEIAREDHANIRELFKD